MSDKLNEAVDKRRQHNAFGKPADKPFKEFLREGLGYVKRAKNVVTSKVGDVIDSAVPDTESERVENATIRKINRDEAMAKANYLGEAVGNQVAEKVGFLAKLGYSAVKSATGLTSAKVKGALKEIDELDEAAPDTDTE
mgnify:FL=1|jgi:hypothetical protein|tara:strand:- start:468 stop:884 length:417 start_codon:yes stop_codon:yes gene_type:complete